MAGNVNTAPTAIARLATKFRALYIGARRTKADPTDEGASPSIVRFTIQQPPGQSVDIAEVVDTSGNVLFAIDKNGQVATTNTPTKAALGQLQYADVSITNTQLKALRATPKTLVAAPGSGRMIEFVSAQLLLKAGTNALTESTANLGVKFTDGSGVQVSQTIEMTGFIDQAADTLTSAEAKIDAIVAKTGADNQALVLHNLGAGEFGGNAANDATLKVRVLYRVHATA